MSAGTDGNDSPEMVKLDVKVTKQQKEEIDRTWKAEGYPNRSEFIRDVLRDATNPMLTADALRRLAEGVDDVDEGLTVSLEEAKERLGLEE